MKKLTLLSIVLITGILYCFSQTPQAISYQAVARDTDGSVLIDQAISVRISILTDSTTGTTVYSESHDVTTNAYGAFAIEIGSGTVLSGTFPGIDWGTQDKFIKVEADPAGGTNYEELTISQFVSVPYALHAENVTNKDDADADAANEIQALAISNDTIYLSDGGFVEIPEQNGDFSNGGEIGGTHRYLGNTDNYGLGFKTYDSTRMFIDSLGNVGIGTTSPGAKLDVNGNINIASGNTFKINNETMLNIKPSTNNIFIGLGAGQSHITGGYNNTFIGMDAGRDVTTGGSNTFIGLAAGRSNTTGDGDIFIGYCAGTFNNGNQNVCIGGHSGHSNNGSNNVYLGSGSGLYSDGSNNIFLGYQAGYNTSGSNKLIIENSDSSTPLIYGEFDNDLVAINGNLGINTTTPSGKLHVQGGTTGSTDSSFVVTSDGKVGIGTTSIPTAMLQVGRQNEPPNGTVAITKSLVVGHNHVPDTRGYVSFNTGSVTVTQVTEAVAGINGYKIKAIPISGEGYPAEFALETHNGTSYNEALRVDKDGNFGINTTTPSGKFHVQGGTTGTADSAFVITSDGNVGIGTTSPAEKLEVAGKLKIGAYTLPETDGTTGQVLATDSNGTLSWTTNDDQTLTEVLSESNDAGSQNITNLTNPVNDQDAATKAYVDALEAKVTELENRIFVIEYNGGNDSISDIDGNYYKIVKIGEQYWMAENLKTTHYSDGTALVDGTDSTGTMEDYTTKYYFWYNNDSASYADTYGALYIWAAVMNEAASSDANPSGVQGVCPTSWHVPGDSEWKELGMYLGMSQAEADNTGWRGTDEGGKLKETGTTHWTTPNTGATNESGFTAIPAGARSYDDTFNHLGNYVFFHSATEFSSSRSWEHYLKYDYSQVARSDGRKDDAFSVRCLKD